MNSQNVALEALDAHIKDGYRGLSLMEKDRDLDVALVMIVGAVESGNLREEERQIILLAGIKIMKRSLYSLAEFRRKCVEAIEAIENN